MNSVTHINYEQNKALVPSSEKVKGERKPKTCPNITEFLQDMKTKILQRDSVGYRRRQKKWLINWVFYNGDQYGFWENEAYYSVESTPRRKFYINNYFSAFIEATQKEWARSKTELTVHPADDKPETAGASRVASYILAHYQRKLRNPIDHQSEGLTAAMCGTYFRYSYYSTKAISGMGRWPKVEQRDFKIADDAYSCPCGAVGAMTDLVPGMNGENICPDCGYSQYQIIEAPNIQNEAVTGYEEYPVGDIVSENVDPFEIHVSPSARSGRIETSPYILRERMVHVNILEDTFQDQDFTPDAALGHNSYHNGLTYQRMLERSPGSVTDTNYSSDGMHGTVHDDEMCMFQQMWLDTPLYSRYQFPVATMLGSIQVPANTPLGEVFPDGLYVAYVNNRIVDARNENKNRHWVAGVYKIYPASFWGRGVEDAIWQQRLLNDAYNLVIEYLKRCSSPTVLYNSLYIPQGTLSGTPGEAIPIENLGLETPLTNLYLQVSPSSMPNYLVQFIEECKRDMQHQLGANSTLSGTPDIDITTATGIKLLRESSIALIAMALAIKAEVDAIWGQQILELAKENLVLPAAIPIQGEYGQVEIKWFSNADIAANLVVTYAEHSVIPRSEIERRNDVLDAMSAGNIPMGIWNPQVPAELRKLLSERLNIPYSSDTLAQIERQAKIRLDRIIELVGEAMEMAPQVGPEFLTPIPVIDPMTGMPAFDPLSGEPITEIPAVKLILGQVPINKVMDDHDGHMRYIQTWFLSDDGLFANDLLQEVMNARFEEHFNGKIFLRQKNSMGEIQAQGPEMMMAQMAGSSLGGAAMPRTQAPKPTESERIAPPAKPAV